MVPRVLALLPEPAPDPDEDPEQVAREGLKPLYTDLAAAPGLAVRCAAVAGLAGAVVGGALGATWALLVVVPVVPAGVLLAYVDLRTRLLPTRVVRPVHVTVVVLAGVLALVQQDARPLLRGLVAMAVVGAFFFVLWFVRSTGMGYGDVRLSALLGFVLGHLGWGEVVVGTYAAFVVFGLPGLLLAVVRRDRALLRTPFPFGPAMLVGALVGIVWGGALWSHLVGGGA
nr:A24 family peptidase [Nocardioides luti]